MLKFAELKAKATNAFGEFGAWVYDEWKRLNDTFFYGKNVAGAIAWENLPQDSSLGYYYRTKNLIVLHNTLMRPVYPCPGLKRELRRSNTRMISDILLHEMIHQKVYQTGGWTGENSHNNEQFVNEVNRIANLLGFTIKARVLQSKPFHGRTIPCVESECLSFKELSHFPYLSRNRNYYYA